MNTPLQHLNRGFEEKYVKLVVPLKRRYTTLKVRRSSQQAMPQITFRQTAFIGCMFAPQWRRSVLTSMFRAIRTRAMQTTYLKDKRTLEHHEDDTVRARAEAAKPIWMEASKLLRVESTALAEAIASNLANWTTKMVSLHRDGLLAMASTFKDAAKGDVRQ